MDNDLERVKNMKLLLCAFEQLSGLKINFHKVNCFALEQLKLIKMSMLKPLGVM